MLQYAGCMNLHRISVSLLVLNLVEVLGLLAHALQLINSGHSGYRGCWTPEGLLCWLGQVTETALFFAFVGDVEDRTSQS